MDGAASPGQSRPRPVPRQTLGLLLRVISDEKPSSYSMQQNSMSLSFPRQKQVMCATASGGQWWEQPAAAWRQHRRPTACRLAAAPRHGLRFTSPACIGPGLVMAGVMLMVIPDHGDGVDVDTRPDGPNLAGIFKGVPNPNWDRISHILEWKRHMLNEESARAIGRRRDRRPPLAF